MLGFLVGILWVLSEVLMIVRFFMLGSLVIWELMLWISLCFLVLLKSLFMMWVIFLLVEMVELIGF